MNRETGMFELGAEQKKIVARKKGPVLMLSGAGTGKTTVLAHRYVHLRRSKPQEPILLLCANPESVRRIRALAEQIGGSSGAAPWIHSFHQVACRLLRETLLPGVPFTVYNKDDREILIRAILKEFKMHEALFRGIAVRISSLKAQHVTPEIFISGKDSYGFDEKIARIYGRYQEELRKNRAMDYDDLINRAVEILEDDKDLRKKISDRFKHVLVDDFQDLTPAQYGFVRILAGKGGGLFVSGDDDQSILAHRGADGENIQRFQDDFTRPAVVRFVKNYRCAGPVLNAAEAVIAEEPCRCDKDMKPTRSGDDMPVYSCTGDEIEEAQHIAYLLKDLYLKDKYGYGEMCVLYRIQLQGKVIADVLKAEGIPVKIPSSVPSFFRLSEVRDVLAYLRVLCNHQDGLSLARIINKPNRGVGEATLNRIRQEARKRDLSLFETVEQMGKSSKTLAKSVALLKTFRAEAQGLSADADVVPVLRRLLERAGYADWILEQDGEGETAARRLGELLAMADGMSVWEFLDHAALRSGGTEANAGEAVHLLTIHQVKGQEFPVVFVAGLEEGMLPYVASRRAVTDIAEERRLAYVAMTRARDRLYLSGARRRKTFTGLQDQKPSRFLKCLPDDLCRRFERSTRTEAAKDVPKKKRPAIRSDAGFPVGARVRHTTWGVGVVRDCNGQGDTARVTVNFPTVGIKRLAVKFAKLERV